MQIFLTQSSRRRGERRFITKFSVIDMLFLIFIIMKINMKGTSGFLITNSPLRPLRLCVIKILLSIFNLYVVLIGLHKRRLG
jgi:hypothetical protein